MPSLSGKLDVGHVDCDAPVPLHGNIVNHAVVLELSQLPNESGHLAVAPPTRMAPSGSWWAWTRGSQFLGKNIPFSETKR